MDRSCFCSFFYYGAAAYVVVVVCIVCVFCVRKWECTQYREWKGQAYKIFFVQGYEHHTHLWYNVVQCVCLALFSYFHQYQYIWMHFILRFHTILSDWFCAQGAQSSCFSVFVYNMQPLKYIHKNISIVFSLTF